MRIMTASRQSELEQSNAKLLQEVDRLTRENTELLKLLGNGDLSTKLTVRAQRFSKTAREKIEKAMERWVVRNADHVVVTAPLPIPSIKAATLEA